MEKYSPNKSQNNKSIEDLESVLRQQRDRLTNLQQSQAQRSYQASGKFNGEKSLEFELSKASPLKKASVQRSQNTNSNS